MLVENRLHCRSISSNRCALECLQLQGREKIGALVVCLIAGLRSTSKMFETVASAHKTRIGGYAARKLDQYAARKVIHLRAVHSTLSSNK